MRTWVATSVLLLSFASFPALAGPIEGSDTVHVTALAVAETSQGFVGVHADVEARVLSGGSGAVFVSTKPLAQTDMQGSARLAAQVAASTLGLDWRSYDYLIEFRSESTVIGGPSAGAVMTLALTTALQHLVQPATPWVLNATVAATGTINPDGTIGPVGGIPAKAEGAKAAGITTFLYPAGLEQATTQTVVNGFLRTVTVDMAAHCETLQIHCFAVATLDDVLRHAAGVDFERADTPPPSTQDYAAILGTDVMQQVAQLQERIQRGTPSAESVPTRSRNSVTALWESAQQSLEDATASLAAQSYYLAATRAFQGNIHAGRAENMTRFYTADDAEIVVQDAIAGCDAAVASIQYVEALQPADRNALDAVGAAQVRLVQARDLQASARANYLNAFSVNDWVNSIYEAAFCTERATTVTWWADLQGRFGEGPALVDLEGLVRDQLDQATDMVLYAEAVLGSAPEARDKITEAQDHLDAGRWAGAWVAAVEAETSASGYVQTGGGQEVPAAVLDAALQSASRAIGRLRAEGAEPILSVSLIELAQDQDPAHQLAAYWEARSLALASATFAPVLVPPGASIPSSSLPPSDGELVDSAVPYGVMGLALGAMIALVATVLVLTVRRS